MQQRFDRLCSSKCDIAKELPYLIEFGKGCKRIVEFGVRGGCSMTAWLLCKPDSILGVDIHLSNLNNSVFFGEGGLRKRFEDYAQLHRINFELVEANSLKIKPIVADLLFIDTMHTNKHAGLELKRHGDNVKKFILLHDIGKVTEAVDSFVNKRKNWTRLPDIQGSPGLGIIKRRK